MSIAPPPSKDTRPHFFLSYARSRYRPDNNSDPDRWVTKLFNDLCTDVSHATGTSNPGFMDKQIPVGTDWPGHLEDALSKCRVFVALFSPAYFDSEYCGKEWAAFAERAEEAGVGPTSTTSAIISALWMPMNVDELPPAVTDVQYVPPDFPAAYATEGLYGIMKLARYREQYKETVLRLAKTIKERAATCALSQRNVSPLASLTNPFAERETKPRQRTVRLTLAAQSIKELPEGRDPYYYGHSAEEWNPYRTQDQTRPIGACAEEVLSELGHQAIVTDISKPEPSHGDAPDAPSEGGEAEPLSVLIVDPWSVKDSGMSERLRVTDQHPTNVLAPFNSDDRQTAEAAPELTAGLEASSARAFRCRDPPRTSALSTLFVQRCRSPYGKQKPGISRQRRRTLQKSIRRSEGFLGCMAPKSDRPGETDV